MIIRNMQGREPELENMRYWFITSRDKLLESCLPELGHEVVGK